MLGNTTVKGDAADSSWQDPTIKHGFVLSEAFQQYTSSAIAAHEDTHNA